MSIVRHQWCKNQSILLLFLLCYPLEPSTGVVLLHGASGTMHTPHMERLAVVLAGQGVTCVRYTFISPKVENRAAKLKVRVHPLLPPVMLRVVIIASVINGSSGAFGDMVA